MSNPTVQVQQLQNILWLAAGNSLYSVSGSNHIWRIRISTNVQHINHLGNLLTADEHERAGRYYREQDQHRFIISRAALRILLAKYLNLNANELIFEIGQNKKPHVKHHSGIHYNVSHSGDLILIGISDAELGVDVELPDDNMHYQEIMPISYSKSEADYVNNAPHPLQAFYTLWTRKESLLKATAKGIDDGLKFIPSTDGLHTTMYNIIGLESSWIVSSFKVDDEHLGSIASTYFDSTFYDWMFGT